MKIEKYDIVVIGGGPAGIAASCKAAEDKKISVCLIEREESLGGILKQCIHDGFGLIRYKEKLTGPEYAFREIKKLESTDVKIKLNTFLTRLSREGELFVLEVVNENGGTKIFAKSLILAMGCRERSEKQIFITGDRPVGVWTAGVVQYYVNIMGYMPCKKVVILGSGDIGLIMARRLTLEGAKVLGVYEIKSEPSGLTRNISQCLDDFNIPLHLSMTVTKIIGQGRLKKVIVAKVDENFRPIAGTEEEIPCDSLILSVGLIPENDILENLDIKFDKNTKGPKVDQTMESAIDGIFSCGNSLHVQDLVDYVSETGEIAGESAVKYVLNKRGKRNRVKIIKGKNIFTVVPQYIDLNNEDKKINIYFRSLKSLSNINLIFKCDKIVKKTVNFKNLKPAEMEKIVVDKEIFENSQVVKIDIQEIEFE